MRSLGKRPRCRCFQREKDILKLLATLGGSSFFETARQAASGNPNNDVSKGQSNEKG